MDWPFGASELNLFARPAAVLGVIPIRPGLFRLVSNGPEPLSMLPSGSKVQEEVWRPRFASAIGRSTATGPVGCSLRAMRRTSIRRWAPAA